MKGRKLYKTTNQIIDIKSKHKIRGNRANTTEQTSKLTPKQNKEQTPKLTGKQTKNVGIAYLNERRDGSARQQIIKK